MLNTYKNKYSSIYIEDKSLSRIGDKALIQPYIYIVRYTYMHPVEFQKAKKRIKLRVAGWDHFVQLDKYYFITRAEIEKIAQESLGKNLYVLQTPSNRYKLLTTIVTDKYNFFFYEKPLTAK